ncbi:hypothetical protein HYZ80_01975 [Candidatus Parcubacteria bacterium]|nr:hypothetical protein [Candidatus Parcubacteria bacterium]
MADEGRDRRERRRQRPSVEITNTPLALAADDTYSTTLRAFARGDWEGEIPEAIFYMDGERFGRAVPVQDRYATKAITGLGPGHHYLAEVAIGGQRTERLLMVPELPKQKSAEEVSLEHDKLKLERTKVAAELARLRQRPDSNEKKLVDARLRLELARIDAELKKLGATPSDTERNVTEARLKLELARITADLEKLGAQPSSLEKQVAEAKLRRELAQIEQELDQASQIRRADDWEIKVSGEDGKQTIRVAVFDAAKQPVPDWQVEIVGAGIDPPIRRTDADGIVEFKMDFAEKSRGVHLFLRGTSKDHRLSLDGPVRDVSNKPFYVLGILNVILLVVGLTMVGFNPSSWEVKLTAPPSEIAQRYRNEYRFGKFKTDAELDREGIKVQRPQPKMVSGFVKWYWRGFWASIIVMIVCFFAVFRDDARRSWRRAKQSITRKYGVGEVDIREGRASLGETVAAIKQGKQTGGQPGATPTAGETPLTSRQFWRVYPLMELGISFLSDMVSNAVFHRKSA